MTWTVYEFARAAVVKRHRLGGLNNKVLFPQNSRGKKYEINVLARLVSSEGLSLFPSSSGLFI